MWFWFFWNVDISDETELFMFFDTDVRFYCCECLTAGWHCVWCVVNDRDKINVTDNECIHRMHVAPIPMCDIYGNVTVCMHTLGVRLWSIRHSPMPEKAACTIKIGKTNNVPVDLDDFLNYRMFHMKASMACGLCTLSVTVDFVPCNPMLFISGFACSSMCEPCHPNTTSVVNRLIWFPRKTK